MSVSASSRTAPADRGQCQTIDLAGTIALIDGHWQQRGVAEMNDYQFKVMKFEGEFVWQEHGSTNETFIVLEGELHIDFGFFLPGRQIDSPRALIRRSFFSQASWVTCCWVIGWVTT
jgi:hypothetical protein